MDGTRWDGVAIRVHHSFQYWRAVRFIPLTVSILSKLARKKFLKKLALTEAFRLKIISDEKGKESEHCISFWYYSL